MELRQCSVLLVLIITLSKSVDGTLKEIKCPEFCKCDQFQKLRRAVCENKKLVSIVLNVPAQAQILDVSHNQISQLGDSIFLETNLTDLRLLNLTDNKLRQIHFNGFKGLDKLKTLDLSYNAIEYFSKSWFASLTSLRELYLRNNKLKSINEEPRIEIPTLRVLDISKCGITHLRSDIFVYTPNLEVLDISENYLQRVTVEVIQPLPKLTVLNALHNNFFCKDRALHLLKKYIKKVGISYRDPCVVTNPLSNININNNQMKFQKMVMAVDNHNKSCSSGTCQEEKNSWIFDDTELNNTKIIEVCSNNTPPEINVKKTEQKSWIMQVIDYSPALVISLTFVYGFLFGIFIGYSSKISCLKKDLQNEIIQESQTSRRVFTMPNVRPKNESQRGRSSVLYNTLHKFKKQLSRDDLDEESSIDESLILGEFDVSNSTPMQPRKEYVTEGNRT